MYDRAQTQTQTMAGPHPCLTLLRDINSLIFVPLEAMLIKKTSLILRCGLGSTLSAAPIRPTSNKDLDRLLIRVIPSKSNALDVRFAAHLLPNQFIQDFHLALISRKKKRTPMNATRGGIYQSLSKNDLIPQKKNHFISRWMWC